MARRTNIVSFEEARAASGARSRRRRDGAEAEERSTQSSKSARRSSSRSRRGADEQSKQTGSSRRTSRKASDARAREDRATDDAREARRRNRNKARASRLFDKQFGSEPAADAAQGEGAPRAALYEAQMGASHKRAARMQRASDADPVSAKVNPAGWFSNIDVSPRSLKVCTALICIVLTVAFLYVPAQQYYQSIREHDRLEAEYAVIEQRNKALDEQNDSLASDAGMEDAVRQKYGYVVKGDQTAIVTGLSEEATDTSRDSDYIEANVLASSVKAPEEWYTPYLDAFFGVS